MQYPNGNGVLTTTPSKASVRAQLENAMNAWAGAAGVRFVYMSNLDGSSCNNSGSNPGVDFVIQHYQSDCMGIGPWPSNSWSDQRLLVPLCGLPGT